MHLCTAAASSLGRERREGAQRGIKTAQGQTRAARGLRPRANSGSSPPEGFPRSAAHRRRVTSVGGLLLSLSPRRRHAEAQQGGQAAAAAALQGWSVRHPLGLHPGRALLRF